MPDISSQISSTIKGLNREFDLITHNLANVSTPGFKRRYNDFSKSLTAQQHSLDKNSSENIKPSATAIDFTQGNFIETGRELDIALCGKGFFVIETPQGPLYTRNGMFRLNDNNQIVDLSGRIVSGQSGPLTIPSSVALSQITITTNGTITGSGVRIGQFKLVDFPDKEHKLTPVGLNCFKGPQNLEPEAAENMFVKQGFQEGSNVQMMEEMVDMIMVTRLYEANMKFISRNGEMNKNLIDVAMS